MNPNKLGTFLAGVLLALSILAQPAPQSPTISGTLYASTGAQLSGGHVGSVRKAPLPERATGLTWTAHAASTAITLIFDSAIEEAFIKSVQNIDKHGDHGFSIMDDPGYMIYLVDEDRDDSPTGMVHFISYGAAGPWKEIFDGFSESNGNAK